MKMILISFIRLPLATSVRAYYDAVHHNSQPEAAAPLPPIEQEDISPCSIGPSILFSDNEAAIDLSYNPVLHQRTSHVNRLYHGIRTWIKHRVITVQKVPTGLNDANIHTKCSPSAAFINNRKQMGFHCITDTTDDTTDQAPTTPTGSH